MKYLITIFISAVMALFIVFTIHMDMRDMQHSHELKIRKEKVYYEDQFFIIEQSIAKDSISEEQAEPIFRKLENYYKRGITMEFDAINEIRVICPNYEGE